MALQFGETERLAASLFDQVFQHDVYQHLKIDIGTQTFEKIQVLTDYLQTKLADAETLIGVTPVLDQVRAIQHDTLRLFNDKSTHPLLAPLLSRSLISANRVRSLFGAVKDYADHGDTGPIYRRDTAFDTCDEFESEARSYGTTDADRILGSMARGLKAAVKTHFESLETRQQPSLDISPVAKKYPLAKPGTKIVFKVRITNGGTGPARDLRIDEVVSDACLSVDTSETALGTIQVGDSFVLDIAAEVVTPSPQASLLAVLSWARAGVRDSCEFEFRVEAQREDVDWERVELTEPYSLEAVTSENDLIGRKTELRQLRRLANLKAVGSGFIHGQKRVGKTSLANAVFQLSEVSVPRRLFEGVLDRIGRLSPAPS